MELFQVDITGFRKFKEKTELKTPGKVLAILGANEAGKSSLLKALVRLNDNEPFLNEEKSTSTDGNSIQIEAKFSLSDEDRRSIGLPGARWYILTKKADGKRQWSINPPQDNRDYSHRPKLQKDLDKIIANKKAVAILSGLSEEIIEKTKMVVLEISKAKGDLSDEIKAQMAETSDLWLNVLTEEVPNYLHAFCDNLRESLSAETAESAIVMAGRMLTKRVPDFLIFGDEDRNLRSYYSWAELINVDTIPPALKNLANIAGLDLPRLAAAVIANVSDTENDNIIDSANNELVENFKTSWTQSKISVVLSKSDQYLLIQVRNNENRRTDFDQRSDGLRQFVALRCFTVARGEKNFVLLIDEAEQHLHYDAQADLVQMFGKQEVATKVIYTTHSVGCLPEDLGNGVRLIEPTRIGSDWSRIENKFWKHKPGNEAAFSPILMGMGASTMAFFPTRSAVLLEGASDSILVPTMFREALGLTSLGVQFIHGVSEGAQTQLPILNSSGKRVVYLLDNDKAGQTLRTNLIDKGLKDKNIFLLQCRTGDSELEDFIDSDLLAMAVKKHAELYLKSDIVLSSGEIPKRGKWDYIEKVFERAKLNVPSKVDVAYSILDFCDADPSRKILDKKLRPSFTAIAKKVCEAAIIPSASTEQ